MEYYVAILVMNVHWHLWIHDKLISQHCPPTSNLEGTGSNGKLLANDFHFVRPYPQIRSDQI